MKKNLILLLIAALGYFGYRYLFQPKEAEVFQVSGGGGTVVVFDTQLHLITMNRAADELRAHCRAQLAGFKVPKQFVFGPVPKTNTGKIQKFLLRQQARSASAIDV